MNGNEEGIAMNRTLRLSMFVAAAMLVLAAPARAEVTVSVTINGSLDEIIPILELLRDMGIGQETLGEPGDPLRLDIHSVSTVGVAPESPFEEVSPAPVHLEPAGVPEPATALTAIQFAPSPAEAGQDVLVTVNVLDPEKRVDTLVAEMPTVVAEDFDLYDNGTHGDVTPNDSLWSATLAVPKDLRPGEYGATIQAYDPHGNPVQTAAEGAESPLSIQGNLVVTR